MHCHHILIAICTAILCLGANIAQGREIVSAGALSAHVHDSFQCRENIELIVKAPDHSFFSKGNSKFQRLIGTARAILGFECTNIKEIAIVGEIGNSRVYQGHSHENQGWLVVQDSYQDNATPKPVPPVSKKPPMLKASSSDHVIKSLKVPADKRAWTTQLIGTWSGRIHRQDLELAVWIPKLDSPQSAQARLNLYMESTDGRCIYGDTQGHLAQAYAFNLPATPEVYDEIQLRYYFMPDVYNETREGRNYCSKNRDIYPFYLYYDYASGQVFAHPKGYQPGSSDAQKWQWPLQRTNPSPKMKQFLIGLEQKYGKGFFSGQKPLLMVSHCLDSDAMVVVKKLDVPGYTVKEVYSSGMEIELSRTEGYTMRCILHH